jgi:hypothetical protein
MEDDPTLSALRAIAHNTRWIALALWALVLLGIVVHS